MLDIKLQWLLILAANFLVLLFILNKILFQPLLKVFKERDDATKGALETAREMNEKKDAAVARMNKELSEARHQAKDVFEALKNEGLEKQKAAMSEAEAAAGEMLSGARAELKAEAEKARQSLKADVEKFSDEIVGKMVKA